MNWFTGIVLPIVMFAVACAIVLAGLIYDAKKREGKK